jgi:predicted TPR repeat methyltransferase
MGAKTVVDLGCGDGGMLSLLKESNIKSWGYDLAPKNIKYANEVRNVDARYTDFNNDSTIEYADISIMTEVLEHLEDPHGVVRDLPSKYLIASSPYHETDKNYYEFHLWAWDVVGYNNLLEDNGYKVLKTELIDGSQVLLGVRK